MLNSNGKISRPVLVLEWLMCFVPLTMIWIAAVRHMVGFGVTADILVASAFGTLGPIALFFALFSTLARSKKNLAPFMKFIAGAFALMCVLQLADAGAAGRLNLSYLKYNLSVFVLLSLLPLVGALHLLQLSKRSEAS